MLSILGALSAIAGSFASATQPVTLEAERAGEGIKLKVVGASERPMAAEFDLEVTSQTNGGSSSTMQSGSARLEPNNPVTLSNVALGGVTGGSWTAKLRVRPKLGEPYEIVRRSEDLSSR